MEGKIRLGQDAVRGECAQIRELILYAVVRTRMEVASGAGCAPVAAGLHIPEQRLAPAAREPPGPSHIGLDWLAVVRLPASKAQTLGP